MSVRGLSALNSIGLGNHVAEEYGIPMRARMIHRLDGTTYPVPYGKEGQAIYSVGRRYVNEILLTGNYVLRQKSKYYVKITSNVLETFKVRFRIEPIQLLEFGTYHTSFRQTRMNLPFFFVPIWYSKRVRLEKKSENVFSIPFTMSR